MPSLIILSVVLLGAALFTRFTFLFLASYLLIAMLVLTHLWVWRMRRGLRVRREFAPRVFQDETVKVTIHIENRSLLPVPWLSVREALPTRIATYDALRQVVRLRPKGATTIEYTLPATHRGYHRLGPLQVRFGDVFGLASQDLLIDTAEFVIVYPQIIPIEAFQIESNTPFGDMRSHQRIYLDPIRVVGAREYEPGDSQRLINWKATAAAGRLMVRNLEPAVSHEIQILVDLNHSSYSRMWRGPASEMAVTAAASLAAFMLENRQSVGVVVNGLDPIYLGGVRGGSHEEMRERMGGRVPRIPIGRGRGHLMSCLDLLARVELLAGESAGSAISTAGGSLPWGATLIVLTGLRSNELLASLMAQRKLGHRVIVVFTDGSAATLAAGAARAAGLTAFAITDKEQVRVWRHDRAAV